MKKAFLFLIYNASHRRWFMSADRNTVTVGYVRVATGSARKREASVYLQRQAILRYAQIRSIKIARFFADHDCIADIAMRQG